MGYFVDKTETSIVVRPRLIEFKTLNLEVFWKNLGRFGKINNEV
jgi:hypothetical protein